MAIYGPAPCLKGRTFELWVLNRWVFYFCLREMQTKTKIKGTDRDGDVKTDKDREVRQVSEKVFKLE